MAPSCDEGRAENEAEGERDSAMLCRVLRISIAFYKQECTEKSSKVLRDKKESGY
jgi:hypothetical protein